LNRARELTLRFPDYWPGWLEYADQLYHVGPLFGHDLRQASQAFQRVLQLNPRLVPAWDHLGLAATVLEDTALLQRAIGRLDSLRPCRGSVCDFWRIVVPMQLHLMRGGSFEGPLADTVMGHTAWIRRVAPQARSATWFSTIGRPAAQIAQGRRVLADPPSRLMAAFHRKGIASAWATRGAWDSALAAMDTYAEQAQDLADLSEEEIDAAGASPQLARLDPYRIAVVGAWLGGLDPRLAAARRAAAVQ
jgi:hypothetical protein